MQTKPAIFVVLFSSLLLFAAGCAESVKSKKVLTAASVESAFSRFKVSSNLKAHVSSSCDSKAATEILNASIPTDAEIFLTSCETVFSCSDTARGAVRAYEIEGLTFNIGLASFKDVNLSGQLNYSETYLEKMNGIFIPNNNRIYIDKNISTTYEACSVLLHEMSHRADPRLNTESNPSFDTEMPAYYLQTAFAGEIVKNIDQGTLSSDNQKLEYKYVAVKEADLFSEILSFFKKSNTSLKVSDFEPFSWEK